VGLIAKNNLETARPGGLPGRDQEQGSGLIFCRRVVRRASFGEPDDLLACLMGLLVADEPG
jgi:hypothetical protein